MNKTCRKVEHPVFKRAGIFLDPPSALVDAPTFGEHSLESAYNVHNSRRLTLSLMACVLEGYETRSSLMCKNSCGASIGTEMFGCFCI